jgi:hypothetical protein
MNTKNFLGKTKRAIAGSIHAVVRRMTSWAWQKEIGTCEGLAVLKGLDMDENKMDIKIQQDPALAIWIAKCFASMVADAPNYVEMRFEPYAQWKGKWEWLTVHIQKGNGKTPHQLRREAEAELEKLMAQLNPPNESAQAQPPTATPERKGGNQ